MVVNNPQVAHKLSIPRGRIFPVNQMKNLFVFQGTGYVQRQRSSLTYTLRWIKVMLISNLLMICMSRQEKLRTSYPALYVTLGVDFGLWALDCNWRGG